MKIKGISILEQHVEKVVFGAAVLIAAFFAAMQFLGPGNTVEIDGDQVSAADVDAVLQSKAVDIRELLNEGADPTVTAPSRPNVFAWFQRARDARITPPVEMLASIPSSMSGLGGSTVDLNADQEFVVPSLVATAAPWVEQHSDAISVDVAEELPESIRAHLQAGPTGNYDLSWATVAAVVDLNALRAQMAATDPAGEKHPIPAQWYNNRLDMVDLELVRQQLVDGQWGNETVIEPIFQTLSEHRVNVNKIGAERMSMAWRKDILDWLREPPYANQALIIQPTFHSTTGSSWTMPEVPTDEEENAEELIVWKLEGQVAALDRQIAELEAQLDEAGGPPPDQPPGGGRDEDDSRGGGFGGGGGGGPDIPGGGGGGSGEDIGGQNEGVDSESGIRLRRMLAGMLNKRQLQRDKRWTELEEAAQRAGIELNPQEQERVYPNLSMDPEVIVWAHDMTAAPGEQYRYSIRVRLSNPFFARESFLVESQQELAQQVAMDVQLSEWTEPVRIKEHTRFFVTSAQPDDGTYNTGRVKLELYRLIDGQWHRKVLDLYPGDPIMDSIEVRGADDAMHTVEFDTGAYILDVIRNPHETASVGGGSAGKVVIALADGTTEIRNPTDDLRSAERLALENSARATEDAATGTP